MRTKQRAELLAKALQDLEAGRATYEETRSWLAAQGLSLIHI